MAGKVKCFFTAGVLAAAALCNSSGQTPADAPAAATPPKRPGGFGGGSGEMHHPGPGSPDFEKFDNVRKAIDALTPEQRKRFQENFLRWSNLSPEEKKALSDRETFRRKKIAEEIESALKESGLELDPERRELFARRYGEERHKIEEQLRKEMDEKRQPLLKDVVAKLKAEFAGSAPAPPQPAPAKP